MGTLEILTLGPVGLLLGTLLFLVLCGVVGLVMGLPYRLITGEEPESNWFYGAVVVVVVVLVTLLNLVLSG